MKEVVKRMRELGNKKVSFSLRSVVVSMMMYIAVVCICIVACRQFSRLSQQYMRLSDRRFHQGMLSVIPSDGVVMDFSHWQIKGPLVIHADIDGVERLLACVDVTIRTGEPRHITDAIFTEEYSYSMSTATGTGVCSSYYEQLDNGEYIRVTKWFQVCDEDELEFFDNVSVTLYLYGTQPFGETQESIPYIAVDEN